MTVVKSAVSDVLHKKVFLTESEAFRIQQSGDWGESATCSGHWKYLLQMGVFMYDIKSSLQVDHDHHIGFLLHGYVGLSAWSEKSMICGASSSLATKFSNIP